MQRKKCLRTLGAALTIVITTLTLASGAAGSQLGGEPDRTGAYNVLHLFTWAKNPHGNLTFDAAGNLYGTTEDGGGSGCGGSGCGAVWKLARNAKGAWTVTILHAFTGGAFTAGVDGAYPLAGLIFDLAGNLYGTTAGGGDLGCHKPYGCGVVFKLTPNPDGTWTESVLHSFTGADGWEPDAGLIFDATGNLYSTTYVGGAYGQGVVFKLTPNPDGTWTESVLYSFTGGADGGYPEAGLIFDAAGDLYGTTAFGGSATCPGGDECGVVFKLAPNPDGTWTESVLHSFTGGADGANPFAGLIFDAAGNLYCTTVGGGDSTACPSLGGCGVVFKLSSSSSGWSETVLHTFIGFGANPYAPVIFDRAGNLYGTTLLGNPAFDDGLMFEITR
jgi:uncharacterized repeat protein (TIGR03803 family)